MNKSFEVDSIVHKVLKFLLAEGFTTKEIVDLVNRNEDIFEHKISAYSVARVRKDDLLRCGCGTYFIPVTEQTKVLHKDCAGRLPPFSDVQKALLRTW